MPARLAAVVGLAAALALGAKVDQKTARSKFVAGVPILNYHLAYDGQQNLAKTENLKQDWTVVVNPGVTDEQVASLCKMSECKAVGHPSSGGVPFFEVSCTESELEKLMQQAKGVAKYVEPDSPVDEVPEIEAKSQAATWGLNRIGADQRGSEGEGATVFILDTGIRVSHNDFTGRASPGADVSSGSLVECNGNLDCAADRQGHGTHCAGSATGNTYGVAPSAQVRSVKVLSDQGSGSWSWSFSALDWLATSSVRPAVASMSLGGSGTIQAMKDAVDAAVAAGVTVVVAAGNDNTDACGFSPAYVPSAITVGSTDSTDARSYFSNYGTCVDIWGPGSSVLSAGHTSDSATATYSGTSMACPHVSGGAALVLGRDSSKNPAAVLAELLADAWYDAISDLRTGDTNALLYLVPGGAPPTTTPVPTPAPPPGTWEVTSGTGCTMTGNCIQSNNHPGDYGNNEDCTINAYEVDITVAAFNTESGYDFLRMGGTPYSGTSGPPSGTFTGVISWASDYSEVRSGWQLCQGSSPGPAPTPAPTTASPTPAPTTQAPTPTPPSPPAPTPPSSGNCSSWCEPPADCVDYPFSCSGCCDGSPSPSPPSPPAPSPPSSGDCYSICDRCTDLTNYPSICGGCTHLC